MTPGDARAAWLPWTADTSWDVDEANAADWTSAECSRLGQPGLLLVEAHAGDYTDGDLGRFASRYTVATRRNNREVRGTGPVLVDTPGIDLLEAGVRHARGSSMCVIEGHALKVSGWARVVGALNLHTGETATRLSEAAVSNLGQLMLYANNGFADTLGKSQTPRLLDRLINEGIGRDELPSLVLAKGASARAAKRVVKVLNLNMS